MFTSFQLLETPDAQDCSKIIESCNDTSQLFEDIIQPLSYPSNSTLIKSKSVQFTEKDVVRNCVKDLTAVQINDICSSSLVNCWSDPVLEGNQSPGTSPDCQDFSNTTESSLATTTANSLRTLGCIPSGPADSCEEGNWSPWYGRCCSILAVQEFLLRSRNAPLPNSLHKGQGLMAIFEIICEEGRVHHHIIAHNSVVCCDFVILFG
ncbi:uncharacterized protein LOC116438291 [Corvus moneduloides]|uniref:uncharacterized protein LOC116438291 n=1 Tax=Corvus moneduloides TaxID=1196302 RepID=UPI00136441EF|nr:uncharacterized protein LOC116438291 [Corvus moneduloides]